MSVSQKIGDLFCHILWDIYLHQKQAKYSMTDSGFANNMIPVSLYDWTIYGVMKCKLLGKSQEQSWHYKISKVGEEEEIT